MALKAVERGGRFGEGDDVEIPVFVVVENCGQIHTDANHWQVVSTVAKIERRRQGDRRRVKRWCFSWLCGVGVHPNAILKTREDVCLSIAVVVPQKAPVNHCGPILGPIPSQDPIVFRSDFSRGAFEHKDSAAVPVEGKQVFVPIEVRVKW